MAESNRATPPLCPCGFWGSTNTSGLCSKCYKEQSQRAANDKALLPSATQQSSSVTSNLASAPVILPSSSAATDTGGPSSATVDAGELSMTLSKDLVPTIKVSEPPESAVPSHSDATAAAITASVAETASTIVEEEGAVAAAAASSRPVQKNKKRCFICKARLELAFTEIGRCKCDYVFCELHRLPEQHDCDYNHKESGRKAALDKMVSPKKHIGTSLKRLDSDH